MTTKLVSANLGLRLTLEVDGKEVQKEFSMAIPNFGTQHPLNLVDNLLDFLNEEFQCRAVFNWVEFPEIEIAKPKKIKAPKKISQAEFNRKIKELVP